MTGLFLGLLLIAVLLCPLIVLHVLAQSIEDEPAPAAPAVEVWVL